MESSKNPDSKELTTFSHDAGTSKIMNQVESSPMISSHGQTSSTGNQMMSDQLRHGNVDEQQPQIEDVNDQQPGSDAIMNPGSSQQAQPNHANVIQQQQQLLLNDLNPRLPINERQRNGLDDQLPQVIPHHPLLNFRRGNAMNPGPIRYKNPHFHITVGNQNWMYNDFRQRVPVRVRQRPPMNERQQLLARENQQQLARERQLLPARERQQLPMRPRRRILINECHELPMNVDRLQPICEPRRNSLHHDRPSQVMPRHPPLVSIREIEPGIFEEIYSQHSNRVLRRMFGVPRCICQNNINSNRGSNRMITVIIHTPNLSKRFSMTTSQEARIQIIFNVYFRLTKETTNTVFVAVGKRLSGEDTPKRIGMKNKENIYTFINSSGYVSRT